MSKPLSQMTPEEIIAEIQAIRSRRATARNAAKTRKPRTASTKKTVSVNDSTLESLLQNLNVEEAMGE